MIVLTRLECRNSDPATAASFCGASVRRFDERGCDDGGVRVSRLKILCVYKFGGRRPGTVTAVRRSGYRGREAGGKKFRVVALSSRNQRKFGRKRRRPFVHQWSVTTGARAPVSVMTSCVYCYSYQPVAFPLSRVAGQLVGFGFERQWVRVGRDTP